ncbi:ABC transporter permease [Aquirhabdus sp.]|uniref:ABC transporter permease n=1 Tax=Aquirhabdus sp. TaxID=2824160 RepID=UPI00396C6836
MSIRRKEKYGTSFWGSLMIQKRVLKALLMREVITRYGRHNVGFLWLFIEPMLFTIGVTALWTLSRASHGSNLPIAAFAVTGYSSVLLWRNMPGRLVGAVESNFTLMYHRQVKIIDVYLSRVILEFSGATASFITLSIIFSSLGWMSMPEDVLKVIEGWLLLTWFGVALAFVVGALSERTEVVDKIWHPFSYILFPLSGSGFMVDWLPTSVQSFVLYLPMVHGIEYLREGYFGSAVKAHYDLQYMIIVCLCLTLFGLIQVRIVSRQVKPA